MTLRWSLVGGDPRFGALTLFMAAHSLALFERLGAHGGRFSDEIVQAVITTLRRA